MTTYYYALTDINGVLCVDRMGEHDSGAPQIITEEQVAALAPQYPDVIYFAV